MSGFLTDVFKKVGNLKVITAVITNMDDVEASIAQLGKKRAKLEEMNAELDSEVIAITEKYTEKAKPLAIAIASLESQIEAYMDANRPQLLKGDAKSVQLSSGEAGWRKNPDRLSLPTGLEEPAVCEKLQKAGLGDYVRVEPSVRRERVKEDFQKVPELQKIGFKVAFGKETFYIKPLTIELKKKK